MRRKSINPAILEVIFPSSSLESGISIRELRGYLVLGSIINALDNGRHFLLNHSGGFGLKDNKKNDLNAKKPH